MPILCEISANQELSYQLRMLLTLSPVFTRKKHMLVLTLSSSMQPNIFTPSPVTKFTGCFLPAYLVRMNELQLLLPPFFSWYNLRSHLSASKMIWLIAISHLIITTLGSSMQKTTSARLLPFIPWLTVKHLQSLSNFKAWSWLMGHPVLFNATIALSFKVSPSLLLLLSSVIEIFSISWLYY
jgi:hypothetical protein